MKKLALLFKLSAILWIIWGLVHILAGVMTVKGILTDDISASVAGIADAVDPSSLQIDYPKASGAIIGQHGFNLFWIGLVTFISAFYIWKGNKHAIFLAAIVGGLADLGYFLFMDLGGYVKFVPGTVMTLVSSAAIILSFYAFYRNKGKSSE
ncbi:hypothetical protein [Poritiphilus flavus]|uniref:DUF2127 domain-containing protein n=1 Tax=Poritiphilus flavus TaxID=2697053 RepID=A0A6L9EHA3_9FLAO|nr:hypothetical protein [Poritiphilus flavus]NAS14091.1 hypothetical protein [Poritiphilus flavus]